MKDKTTRGIFLAFTAAMWVLISIISVYHSYDFIMGWGISIKIIAGIFWVLASFGHIFTMEYIYDEILKKQKKGGKQ